MDERGGALDPQGRRAELRGELAALRARTGRSLAAARSRLRPRLFQVGMAAVAGVAALAVGAALGRRRSRSSPRPACGRIGGAARGLLWSLLARTLARAVEEPLRAWVAGLLRPGGSGSLRTPHARDSVTPPLGG